MINYPKLLEPVFEKLLLLGARPYIIGGFVRDSLLQKSSKDIDIEVYGVASYQELHTILEGFGKVSTVGKSFGVCKLFLENLDLDFTLPRTEKPTGVGHSAFAVTIDPKLDFIKASMRRDFTINAIAYDLQTKQIIDPFGGREDLKNKILRAVNENTFREDPLRVMRAVQFSARFNLKLDPKLFTLCQKMIEQKMLETLPKERIYEEFKKLLFKAPKPSLGFRLLRELKNFSYFDLLKNLSDQEYTTLLRKIDLLASKKELSSSEKIKYFFALLSLYVKDRQKLFAFVIKLTEEKKLLNDLETLLKLHDALTNILKKEIEDRDIRSLASKTILKELLVFEEIVFEDNKKYREKLKVLKQKAKVLSLYDTAFLPFIEGKDLISLGLTPSKEFKEYLQKIFEAQIEAAFSTKEEALLWTKEYIKELS